MKRLREKLTKRYIDSLRPPTDGAEDYIVSDSEDDGLRLRVWASGRKTFALEYRAPGGGRPRWITLGTYGDLTPEQARKEASQLRARVAQGFDPAEAKTRERLAPTFEDYAMRWLDRAALRKKPSSVRNDKLMLRLHLFPAFGRRKLKDIQRADLARLRDSLATKRTTANRCLALASVIFNAAEADDERAQNSNPCRHIERYKERRIERALSGIEMARLWAALDGCDEAPAATAAVRFLVLSGLRCGEALALRWDDIDLDAGRLSLRDSKTGPRRVLLSSPAVALLASLPRGRAHCFPGKIDAVTAKEYPLADLTHPWERIRVRAGLNDVRLHDLRHAFASSAISSGLSLEELAPLMGHRSIATTRRYSHLLEGAERVAAEAAGAAVAAAIATTISPPSEPVTGKAKQHLRLVKS